MDNKQQKQKAKNISNSDNINTSIHKINSDKNVFEIKNLLKEKVIESLNNEYKEISETWKNLESKAQGSIAVAGIFIASAFAYLNEITEKTFLYEKILLTLVIVCLIGSIIFSILALKVIKVSIPPIGEYMDDLLRDLLEIKNDTEFLMRMPLFWDDQILTWKVVKKESLEANDVKANYLWLSQVSLIISVVSISILVLTKIYK